MGIENEQKTEKMKAAYELLLLDYAAGNLDDPQNVVVSTHIHLNENGYKSVSALESIGGALIDEQDQAPLSHATLDQIFDKIDAGSQAPVKINQADCSVFPQPLLSLTNASAKDIEWKSILPGIENFTLDISTKQTYSEILRIAPGQKIASHTHKGQELTLILDGAFEDETGSYGRGELIVADGSITHAPVADAKAGCICLTARTAPLRFEGLVGRLINPFLRH